MKKRNMILISGMVVLTLITGIFIGRTIVTTKDKVERKTSFTTVDKTDKTKKPEKNQELDHSTGTDVTMQDGLKAITIYDIEDGYMQVPYQETVALHSYHWENLLEENGLKYYMDETGNKSKVGIDVSYFQQTVDWNKVKAAGIDFVILRMGYRGYGEDGKLVVDEKFHSYLQEAQSAGLGVGVYFFSQAINEEEAKEEAEFVYQQCETYELSYPVVFDTEKIKGDTARTDDLKPEELTKITIAFCEKIKEYGYEPMIYANAKWLTTKLDLSKLSQYKIWYADYQEKPLYPYEFQMWQYTEKGQIEGIDGTVDLNIWFPQEGK
ncbi:MAG: glycoside hydrolase family 25 protein [Lachnospiraceae bacterium]